MMAPPSAYVHVPFCAHRCGYCNFTLVAGRRDLMASYLQAIEQELRWLARPCPVETLFIGGGTPTELTLPALRQLLELVTHWFPLVAEGEFSVEANPADLTAAHIELLAEYGVNRVSLGAQSFHTAKLQTLERTHRAEDIHASVARARASLRSVSLDLIFGVPGETRAIWQADLQQAIELAPDHVSTYGLTFERGTRFWARRARGHLQPLGEEDECWMYETAIDQLTAAGWEHYEVSNFARPGHRCRHNQAYWNGLEYLAIGPGAARYVNGCRQTNHRSTTTYLKRVLAGQSPVAESEQLAAEDMARERLVFGLRQCEGISPEQFQQVTGIAIDQLVGDVLPGFVEQGLLTYDHGMLRLTRKGLLVSDAIWPYFLRN